MGEEGVKTELTNSQKELNALKSVARASKEYGGRIREALKKGSKEVFYKMASENGYRVRERSPNSKVYDFKKRPTTLSPDNTAIIGPDKSLYVAVSENGKVVDIEDLAHDVGTILLGGKTSEPHETDTISIKTLRNNVEKRRGGAYSKSELEQLQLLNSNNRIETSWLFDAITFQKKIPFRLMQHLL